MDSLFIGMKVIKEPVLIVASFFSRFSFLITKNFEEMYFFLSFCMSDLYQIHYNDSSVDFGFVDILHIKKMSFSY